MSVLSGQTEKLIKDYIDSIVAGSTPRRPLWNIEKLDCGKPVRWNYIDGCMIASLIELARDTGNLGYFEFAERFIDYYVFEDGSIRGFDPEEYNLDNISEGRTLFDLYFGTRKQKYRKAIETIRRQAAAQPRNKHGCFWHKKIYPDQVWLDGLYMAQVFCTRYEAEFGKSDFADVAQQFTAARAFMFDRDKKLYRHGYDASRKSFWADPKTGCSKSFWLRAEGWFAAALADVYEYMTDIILRESIGELLAELLESLEGYADRDSGMFYQVIDRGGEEGNYLETSGSALLAYAFLKAERLGIYDGSEVGLKCFRGICDKYLSDAQGRLSLGGICLMAGLGPQDNPRRDGSYEYYLSEPVVSDDAKALGAFIMAYTEIIKMQKKGSGGL